ncbi:MFS transporter [Aestuariibius sp. 2305UL40-4]|uniref:MFS transporter n=1 Tax=Aestuariibius violaceus TaxID=3234132 RepID=UPI00345E47A2
MNARVSKPLLILLLWFAGLGAAAQFAKIAVPFGLFRQTYPDLGTELGWLLSLVSLVGAILGVVAGSVVGQFGPKRILVYGLALGALMSFWQALLPSFPSMLISRIIEGTSHLAVVVAAPTLIAQISDRRYVGAAMTLWSTFFGVSFAIVAWGIMPFVGAGGLALLLAGHGTFLLAIGILASVFLPNTKTPQPAPGVRSASILVAHRRAYASPFIAAPGAGWLAYTLTFVSLLALLPERLEQENAAQVAGMMPMASIAVSLLVVPLLLRRAGSVAIIVAGFALACALVLLNMFVGFGAGFAIALFAVLGLVQGASFTAVPELNNDIEHQALAYGLMAQLGNTGNLLGTPLLLFVSGRFGDPEMQLCVAFLFLSGIALHAILAFRRTSRMS